MNKQLIHKITGAVAGAALLASGAAMPVFAATANIGAGLGASVGVSTSAAGLVREHAGVSASATGTIGIGIKGASVATIVNRADEEITRRITALTDLSTRVGAMARLSANEQESLSTTIESQIAALSALKAKISADEAANSTTTLKTDVQSIITSYRIYMLVLPQGAIEAAADRILTISGIMSDLSAKFSSRISAAATAGNNVSSSQAALADMNAKIADANTQVQAANTEVASLTPDNGSSTLMQANTAALQDARAKIVASQHDLIAARADAMTIVKALAGYKVSANATTTATVSSSASTGGQ